MIPESVTDHSGTATTPTSARLLHRAVGMDDYELCDVSSATTSELELLANRPLDIGTVVSILMLPEGTPGQQYSVTGRIAQRRPNGAKWLHLLRAPDQQTWSPMFVYDIMYQALNRNRTRPAPPPARRNGSHHPVVEMVHNRQEQAAGSIGHAPPSSGIEAAAAEANGPKIPDVSVYRALSVLVPFSDLNDMIRRSIAHEHEITVKPAGTELIRQGAEDDVAIYLVSGVLQLEGFDERTFYIAAGSNCARYPISLLRPHAYNIRAATDVSVILVGQSLIRKVIQIVASFRNKRNMGIEVTEQG